MLKFLLIALFAIGCTFREQGMYQPDEQLYAPSGEKKIKTGWSASGKLSTPDNAAPGNTPDLSVSLQQDFELSDTYTVQFSLISPDPLPNNKVPAAIARIEWTCAGNTIVREVDIFSGVSVTGVADHIRIVARDNTIDVFGQDAVEYIVSITVSKGTRAVSKSVPLRGEIQENVVGNAPLTVPIPQNIGINAVLVLVGSFIKGATPSDLTYKELDVRQINLVGTTICVWKPLITGAVWIPILPGAASILITGDGNVLHNIDVTVIFGVDG